MQIARRGVAWVAGGKKVGSGVEVELAQGEMALPLSRCYCLDLPVCVPYTGVNSTCFLEFNWHPLEGAGVILLAFDFCRSQITCQSKHQKCWLEVETTRFVFF